LSDTLADSGATAISGWYELFSRGAHDWLRHNEKVREALHRHLPEMIAGGEVLGGSARTVRVPVRMLEHYHFRLRRPEQSGGVGQGAAKPGDQLAGPASGQPGDGRGPGGRDDGGIEFLLEFKVEEIVDWLWEELRLPNLRARIGTAEDVNWTREGWDRKGARSRLDRRRSLRESMKRRRPGRPSPPLIDEDLRFRQLARRAQPATQAVVFLIMDVSASMSEADRKLAKSFFFWAVQGLRREYRHLDTVFIAHTTEAWEFSEAEFFQVSGSGGTVASAGFLKTQQLIAERYSPARYNVYVFYASDGDNAPSDHDAATQALSAIAADASYCGYLEVATVPMARNDSETAQIFRGLSDAGHAAGAYTVSRPEDIWNAVRHFFAHEAARAPAAEGA
jgi:uncharacterized sporulation protein YeaH/YhbH (DUF444 family)